MKEIQGFYKSSEKGCELRWTCGKGGISAGIVEKYMV